MQYNQNWRECKNAIAKPNNLPEYAIIELEIWVESFLQNVMPKKRKKGKKEIGKKSNVKRHGGQITKIVSIELWE